jgi:hypothetical protein
MKRGAAMRTMTMSKIYACVPEYCLDADDSTREDARVLEERPVVPGLVVVLPFRAMPARHLPESAR